MFWKSIRIIRNLTKMKETTETFCQHNSYEAAQQIVVMKDIMCRNAFVC